METIDSTFSYAGLWKRFAAFLFDISVLNIVSFIVKLSIGIPFDVITGKTKLYGYYTFSFILNVLLAWIYSAVMESSVKQATLGKIALGIIVTDLSGKRISFGKATRRYFSKIISGIILGIGFFMIAFTKRKQGLHDIIAGCLVLNKKH